MESARVPQATSTQTNSERTSVAAKEASSRSAMRTTPLYAGPPAIRLGGDIAVEADLPQHVTQLVASPGPGEPLQPHIQNALQSSFKADMGAVRVHTDSRSAAVTDSLAARAFTFGPNIFLGSGEHPTDLSLMAHEGTHVVQQQAIPMLQMSSDMPAADALEQEARSSALAVQRGEQVTVLERTDGVRVQREDKPSLWQRFKGSVSSVVSNVTSAVSSGKDWLLGKAAEWVKRIPGYDLLTVTLGKDPITDKPVERNAVNLLRGLLSLIPGGSAMFDNLQQSGALQKAFEWFNQEIAKLNLTWETIKGLFRQFWDSLSASDFLNPSGVFARAEQLFGAPLKRLLDFARAAGKKILELIFEGALSLAGEFGQQVLRIIKKAGAVFSLIINDPIGFLRNLIQAVKGGFQNFSTNILKHLKNALFEWLFGALQGAGLTLPDKFDFKGILSIILQVLGLTYSRLREKLVKLIGEPAVAFIENAFEFLKIIVTQGIAAAWQKILEFATGLIDTVIEGIRDWAAKTIVGAAITKLVTMFNPVGAIIQGIITIYNTIKFFIERAKQIAVVAEAVFDSINNIATGNIGGAIEYVEKTMARFLPVVIGFLARFIGLGGISDEIKKIIQKIQAVIDNARDKIVLFIVDKAKGLIGKGKEKRKAEDKDKPDDVQEQARQMVLAHVKAEHTKPEVEAILEQVLNEMRPQGVKQLQLGPEDVEGSYAILIEASPLRNFLNLVPEIKRSRSMRSSARVTVKPNVSLTWESMVDLLDPGRSLIHPLDPGYRYTVPPHGTTRGAAVILTKPTEVVVVSKATRDYSKQAATSHAEYYFYTWLERQPWKQDIVAIEIENFPFNPCATCGGGLTALLKQLNAGRPAHSKIHATLTWDGHQPWDGEDLTTIRSTLQLLQKNGWIVNPPDVGAQGMKKLFKVYGK